MNKTENTTPDLKAPLTLTTRISVPCMHTSWSESEDEPPLPSSAGTLKPWTAPASCPLR